MLYSNSQKSKMKISFITTVFNEEKTIQDFLNSTVQQTTKPDEIIIVDAGSTDKTKEIIKKFKTTIPLRLFIKHGNRSVGRNYAISKASGDIIAVSDAGCILHKEWLKQLTLPFKQKGVSVVSGFYEPITKTIFQKALAAYTSVMPDKVNPNNFLPSSRSVAFLKEAWEHVGGYPEDLDTCEDLVFDKKLQKAGFHFVFQKNAIVYWPQRTTLFGAIKQFFSYARGDGKAHYFRKQTPLLFVRYIIGISLFRLGFLFHKPQLFTLCYVLLAFYILWAIWKNYGYVKQVQAYFWLPILQLSSDIAVLGGTTIGFVESILPRILQLIKQNKLFCALLFAYLVIALSQLTWGIPNTQHPFAYNMDEWAQAFSLRTTFRYGTPHIHGGTDGTFFFYAVSGVLLAPFILLNIVNPFVIKSPLLFFDMQQRLFEVLRLQSIGYALGAIILVGYIAKKYFNTSPILSGFLLMMNPIFLMLSIFYRHDIAVVFWILLSLLFLFGYSQKPTTKNYLLTGSIVGLSIAIKISAAPILILYGLAFILFSPQWKKHILLLLGGLCFSSLVAIMTAIPDALISFKQFISWITLVVGPHVHESSTIMGIPYRVFYITTMYPSLFGHLSYTFFLTSFYFTVLFCLFNLFKKDLQTKRLQFLLIGTLLFLLSMYSLSIEARGSRLLVLLPFFALLGTITYHIVAKEIKQRYKIFLPIILGLIIIFQSIDSLSWISLREVPSIRYTSSEWVKQYIPRGSTIGVEVVPIFQDLPDMLLKDYYTKQYIPTYQGLYHYEDLMITTQQLPSIIVLSNTDAVEKNIMFSPQKRHILTLLHQLHYKKIKTFSSQTFYYDLFNSPVVYFNGLPAIAQTISIYERY